MAAPADTACCRIMLQAKASSSGWGAISINLDSGVNTGADMGSSSFKKKNNQCQSGIHRDQPLGEVWCSNGVKCRSTAGAQSRIKWWDVDVGSKICGPAARKRAPL